MNNFWNNKNLIKVLKTGGVVVMPTDTLYGIVARAQDYKAVERIYKIKKRSPDKKLIVLISSWNDTKKFDINASKFKIPKTNVPTSFILNDIAFRLPKPEDLRKLLKVTGPLVAPSANLENEPPAKNIFEAKKYFGDLIDLYIDGGEISGLASRIIKLHNDGSVGILRE